MNITHRNKVSNSSKRKILNWKPKFSLINDRKTIKHHEDKNIIKEISFHNLTKCDKDEINKILEIRNEKKVRTNMFTKHIITKNNIVYGLTMKVSQKNYFLYKYKMRSLVAWG